MQTKKLPRRASPQHPLRRISRLCSFIAALMIVSIVPDARGAGRKMQPAESAQSIAFARYLASLKNREQFEQSRPVAILIEASLTRLYKEASLLAIRENGDSGQPKYHPLAVAGDGTVLAEVISRYFTAEQEMDDVPASGIAITPANYRFRFERTVDTGATSAYIYRIAPKKSRPGLLKGQVWMDSETGAEVMATGRLTKLRSIGSSAYIVRETRALDGSASVRVTHVVFTVPNLGRAELVIKESPLRSGDGGSDVENSLSAFVR